VTHGIQLNYLVDMAGSTLTLVRLMYFPGCQKILTKQAERDLDAR